MSGEPLGARGHLALQTVLRASRDPVIDELRSTVATQAKELQELRGELAEAQDLVQKITQDCDGMREFLADVSGVCTGFRLNRCRQSRSWRSRSSQICVCAPSTGKTRTRRTHPGRQNSKGS